MDQDLSNKKKRKKQKMTNKKVSNKSPNTSPNKGPMAPEKWLKNRSIYLLGQTFYTKNGIKKTRQQLEKQWNTVLLNENSADDIQTMVCIFDGSYQERDEIKIEIVNQIINASKPIFQSLLTNEHQIFSEFGQLYEKYQIGKSYRKNVSKKIDAQILNQIVSAKVNNIVNDKNKIFEYFGVFYAKKKNKNSIKIKAIEHGENPNAKAAFSITTPTIKKKEIINYKFAEWFLENYNSNIVQQLHKMHQLIKDNNNNTNNNETSDDDDGEKNGDSDGDDNSNNENDDNNANNNNNTNV